ncbi:unnamed protein product, partial [Closterium sp. NIES-53]
WDAALLAVIWAHVWWAPFTKVEESFNVQAMHDLLFHRFHLSQYDHFEFPGVVPRTFLGALLVAGLSSPLVAITHLFGASKITALVIVRGTLGFLVFLSFYMLRRQIATTFGTPTARYFALLLLSQFHLPFYASRPLPNVFALALANLAFTYWIKGKAAQALQTLVFAFVVFRCDVLILLAPIGLSLLLTRSIGFFFAVFTCVLTGIASLMLTVSVDSVLWQRFPLWPEGTVLFFNTALNKSSEWGVSSPHWYFTSALPRALLLAYPLSFLGPILDRHMLRFFLPALTFVGLYSFLPHKELRFLFPGLPLFLLSAARALVRLQVLLRATGGSSSISRVVGRIARPLTLLALAVSCLLSSLFALASYRNYPGGAAAILLQQKVGHEPGSVHVDLLPAMTGFSRFTQLPAPWSYSKQEGLTHSQLSQSNFSYLLRCVCRPCFLASSSCLTSLSPSPLTSLHSPVPSFLSLHPIPQLRSVFCLEFFIHENSSRFLLSPPSLPSPTPFSPCPPWPPCPSTSAHPSLPAYNPVANATGFVCMRISIHENGSFFLSLPSLPPFPSTSAHPSVPSYEPVTNASGFVRMRISTSTLFRMPPLRYPFPVLVSSSLLPPPSSLSQSHALSRLFMFFML